MNDNNLRHEGKNITLYVFLYVLIIIFMQILTFFQGYILSNFQTKYMLYLPSIFATYLLPFFYGYFYKTINKEEMTDILKKKLSYWALLCNASIAVPHLIYFRSLILEMIYASPLLFIITFIGLSIGFIILWFLTYLLLGENRLKTLATLLLIWVLWPYLSQTLHKINKQSKISLEQSIERIKLISSKSKEKNI